MRSRCTTNRCPLCRFEPFFDDFTEDERAAMRLRAGFAGFTDNDDEEPNLSGMLNHIDQEIAVLRDFDTRLEEDEYYLDLDLQRPTDIIRRDVRRGIQDAERGRAAITTVAEARGLLHHMHNGVMARCAEWHAQSTPRLNLQWKRRSLRHLLNRFADVDVPRLVWGGAYVWDDDLWARYASASSDATELPDMFRHTMRVIAETMAVEQQLIIVEMLHDIVAVDLDTVSRECLEIRDLVAETLAPTFERRLEEHRSSTTDADAWLHDQVDLMRSMGFADPEIVRIMTGSSLETKAAAHFSRGDARAFATSVVDQLREGGVSSQDVAIWEEVRAQLEAGEALPHVLERLGERGGATLHQMDYVVRMASVSGYVRARPF